MRYNFPSVVKSVMKRELFNCLNRINKQVVQCEFSSYSDCENCLREKPREVEVLSASCITGKRVQSVHLCGCVVLMRFSILWF